MAFDSSKKEAIEQRIKHWKKYPGKYHAELESVGEA